MYIVELEEGCWLAAWGGDLGRTIVKNNAKQYPSMSSATYALAYARRHRPYLNAKITPINGAQTEGLLQGD